MPGSEHSDGMSALSRGKRSQKSRFGCTNCKNRHVKCDEKVPCGNCVRRREPCSLRQSAQLQSAAAAAAAGRAASIVPQTDEDYAMEMFLMHHFTLSTSQTFSTLPSIRNTFRVEFPRLARTHPILISAIVAISALHMVNLNLESSPQSDYWIIYRKHGDRVLSEMRERIGTISEENCDVLFACGCLVAFFAINELSLSDTTLPMDKLSVCGKVAQCMKMIAGLVELFRSAPQAIASGPLGCLLEGHWFPVPMSFQLSADACGALLQLKTAIMSTASEDPMTHATIEYTYNLLDLLYLETAYLMISSAVNANSVLKFNGIVSNSFITLIQEGNEAALLIYAYYSILSASIEGSWCINRRFGFTVLAYVRQAIHPSSHYLLEWPEEQCKNGLRSLLESRKGYDHSTPPPPTWQHLLAIRDAAPYITSATNSPVD